MAAGVDVARRIMKDFKDGGTPSRSFSSSATEIADANGDGEKKNKKGKGRPQSHAGNHDVINEDGVPEVEASGPPGWRRRNKAVGTNKRSEGRGMAALKNASSSRRWSLSISPAAVATAPRSEQPNLWDDVSVRRGSGDSTRFSGNRRNSAWSGVKDSVPTPATGVDLSAERATQERQRSFCAHPRESVPSGSPSSSPFSSSSDPVAFDSPVHKPFSKARDSIGVIKSASSINLRSKSRNGHRGTHDSGSRDVASAKNKNIRFVRRREATGHGDYHSSNGSYVEATAIGTATAGYPSEFANANASISTGKTFTATGAEKVVTPSSTLSTSSPSSTNEMAAYPRAGFGTTAAAVDVHQSLDRGRDGDGLSGPHRIQRAVVEGERNRDGRKKGARGFWTETPNVETRAAPSPAPKRKQKERQQLAQRSSSAQRSSNGARRKASESTFSFLSGSSEILAENAQLKLEKEQLMDALSSALESSKVVKERSRVLAKQAALKVRGAEARRASAVKAAREAEGRAYSLDATVQVLKSTAAAGVGSRTGGVSLREIEAEITAAYQDILQGMDMERAALQEQLVAVQLENNMLRSRAMGLPQTPLSRSSHGGDAMMSTSGSFEREKDLRDSPVPKPRSFGRPKARGISIARESFDIFGEEREAAPAASAASAGGSSMTRRTGGSEARSKKKHGLKGALAELLGARVRLVQLEVPGSAEVFGGGAGAADVSCGYSENRYGQQDHCRQPGMSSSSLWSSGPSSLRPEDSRVAEPSAESWSRERPPSLSSSTRTIPDSTTSTPEERQEGRTPLQVLPPKLPWPKEVVLWWGSVGLIVTPGPSAKGSPKPPSTASHWVLLTDAALYVVETRVEGGDTDNHQAGGIASKGPTTAAAMALVAESDSLCRFERNRLLSLNLPLETRALPNGDEVAVRGTAVVIRLCLVEGGGKVGAASGRGVRAVERGHLWLSCESNEARGEFVERLCEWHQRPGPLGGLGCHGGGGVGRADDGADVASSSTLSTAAVTEARKGDFGARTPEARRSGGRKGARSDGCPPTPLLSAATQAPLWSSPSDESLPSSSSSSPLSMPRLSGFGDLAAAIGVGVGGAVAVAGAGGGAEKAAGGGLSLSRGRGEQQEEEAKMLEVEQVVMRELVEDLEDERSLNVTAVLLADADALEYQAVTLQQ